MNLRIRSYPLALALLVAGLSLAPTPADATYHNGPSLSITPAVDVTQASGTVVIQATVTGFDLKDYAAAGPNVAGSGHIHYFVDGQPGKGAFPGNYATTNTTFVESGLAPGRHTIKVELVNHDHSSLTPPVFKEVAITISGDAPAIAFTAPAALARANDGRLSATVKVDRFTLSDVNLENPTNAPGRGHIHWFVDGAPAESSSGQIYASKDTTFNFANLGPGMHLLRAELVNDDHSSVTPPVFAERYVNAPTLAFATPSENANAGGSVPATVNVENFDLAPVSATPTDTPGQGHLHYFVDGQPAQGSYATDAKTFTFSGLSAGRHVLTAELVNNDHSSLYPPIVATRTITVAGPTIAAIAPTPGASVGNGSSVDFRVDVSGFQLVGVGTATGKQAGQGHIHYLVDGKPAKGEYATTQKAFTFSSLPAGQHTLRAELVNDDHSSLEPPVFTERVIAVAAAKTNDESPAKANTPAPGALLALAAVGIAAAALFAARRRG